MCNGLVFKFYKRRFINSIGELVQSERVRLMKRKSCLVCAVCRSSWKQFDTVLPDFSHLNLQDGDLVSLEPDVLNVVHFIKLSPTPKEK